MKIGDELSSLLELLVQNTDISMDGVTDFGQSDDFACILLVLCKFFRVNIFFLDVSGTIFIAMKLLFLLLFAFEN